MAFTSELYCMLFTYQNTINSCCPKGSNNQYKLNNRRSLSTHNGCLVLGEQIMPYFHKIPLTSHQIAEIPIENRHTQMNRLHA